jgi:hypothetical protein
MEETAEVTPTGSAQPPDFPEKTGTRPQRGAESGAVGAPVDAAELARLVASSKQLPEHIRAAILALIREGS